MSGFETGDFVVMGIVGGVALVFVPIIGLALWRTCVDIRAESSTSEPRPRQKEKTRREVRFPKIESFVPETTAVELPDLAGPPDDSSALPVTVESPQDSRPQERHVEIEGLQATDTGLGFVPTASYDLPTLLEESRRREEQTQTGSTLTKLLKRVWRGRTSGDRDALELVRGRKEIGNKEEGQGLLDGADSEDYSSDEEFRIA